MGAWPCSPFVCCSAFFFSIGVCVFGIGLNVQVQKRDKYCSWVVVVLSFFGAGLGCASCCICQSLPAVSYQRVYQGWAICLTYFHCKENYAKAMVMGTGEVVTSSWNLSGISIPALDLAGFCRHGLHKLFCIALRVNKKTFYLIKGYKTPQGDCLAGDYVSEYAWD